MRIRENNRGENEGSAYETSEKYAEERASRGEVIITQKEAKGEYGNDFTWNKNSTSFGNQELEPHVVDAMNINGVPARTTGTNTSVGTINGYCIGDITISNGELLMGGSKMFGQVSCAPHTGNAGNYYDWIAAIATNADEYVSDYSVAGYLAPNSICPRGWQLPSGNNGENGEKSILAQISAYINNIKNDVVVRTSPLSYVYGGYLSHSGYSVSFNNSIARYWSRQNAGSANAYILYFDYSNVVVSNLNKDYGLPLRCVAR